MTAGIPPSEFGELTYKQMLALFKTFSSSVVEKDKEVMYGDPSDLMRQLQEEYNRGN